MLAASFLTKVLRNGLPKTKPILTCNIPSRCSSLWEPDYLILAKTKTPEYDAINVQLKSYDFVILENFQSLVHKIAKGMNIDVLNAWATPHEDWHIIRFKPNSSTPDGEYKLKLYERNIQVVDVKSHIMALFIEAVVTACPPGVKISIHEHDPEMENVRYVPDLDIIKLKEQLEEIGSQKKKKKRRGV